LGAKLSDASTSDVRQQVELEGFAVVPACLDEGTVEHLSRQFEDTQYPQRNLLSIPIIRQLATSKRVREVMEAVLGPKCFAIIFNKTQSANWKVVWHQDVTVSVRERRDVDGFSSWTMKDGVLHEIHYDKASIMQFRNIFTKSETGFEYVELRLVPSSEYSLLTPEGAWRSDN
jgi:hypothetical protein